MRSIADRLQQAQSLLAPYAVPIGGMLGRGQEEADDETRFPFQRDRDRILHTQAFRRLQGKTQVFVAGEGDHYRTRLTHTMEVAQISRDMARALSLNEDLAECIALAHDLGHPPFGHAGEQALHQWAEQHGEPFEHNTQSHRTVTLLERHVKQELGLNLNKEILHGLLKHHAFYEEHDGTQVELKTSAEAQLVNTADAIAYTGHDTDDGIRAKLFSIDDLRGISLVDEALEMVDTRGTSLRSALIHLLVHDVYNYSTPLLAPLGSIEDVYSTNTMVVDHSPEMKGRIKELRTFIFEHVILHPSVRTKTQQGEQLLAGLCEHFMQEPPPKILLLQERTNSSLARSVLDYTSGMTEFYAKALATSYNL